jgi:curved DNA-binding protein CbpA
MASIRDPYDVLGVSRGASDAEIRSAYRKLVKLHHPDHNGGSEESEQRFEEVQDAYARIVELRQSGGTRASSARGSSSRASSSRASSTRSSSSPPPPSDPNLDARMADLERELQEANAAKERARRAAREAARAGADPEDLRQRFRRATDEELGYVTTDDTFSKILSDAREELSGRLSDARDHPVTKRVESVIEDLEELLTRATRGASDEER